MATVHVKLGFLVLLVAAAVVGTAADGFCVYVVDVATSVSSPLPEGSTMDVKFTVHDTAPPTPADDGTPGADADPVWTRTKVPSGVGVCPTYQFLVYDWTSNNCRDPCRLTLQLAAASNPPSDSDKAKFWIPFSVRIRDSTNSESGPQFDRTFTILPPETVTIGAPRVINKCKPTE